MEKPKNIHIKVMPKDHEFFLKVRDKYSEFQQIKIKSWEEFFLFLAHEVNNGMEGLKHGKNKV